MEKQGHKLLADKDGNLYALYTDGTWSEVIGGVDKFGNRHHVVRNAWLDNPKLKDHPMNPYRETC